MYKSLLPLIPVALTDQIQPLPIIEQHECRDLTLPVALIPGFIPSSICSLAIQEVIDFASTIQPVISRHTPDRSTSNYWTIDCLPSSSHTRHIFNSFLFGNLDSLPSNSMIRSIFQSMNSFHSKYFLCSDYSPSPTQVDSTYCPQILHYPTGGGFFDWHTHPRYPQNYGLCLCLSSIISRDTSLSQGQMIRGQMLFKDDNIFYSGEGQISQGDLVVFRYDIPHAVSGCDTDFDLCYSDSGHFMAINPIL